MDVKNNLNQIMVERNLSYRQLERMTGVSHSMLNKICMGETDPTQTTMILIEVSPHTRDFSHELGDTI